MEASANENRVPERYLIVAGIVGWLFHRKWIGSRKMDKSTASMETKYHPMSCLWLNISLVYTVYRVSLS